MRSFIIIFASLLSLAAAAQLPEVWVYLEDSVGPAPPRIDIPPPAAIQQDTKPTKCIKECVKSQFKAAGCSSETHWDCLCRSEGLAKEVQICAKNKCTAEEDIGSLKLQNFICQGGYESFANRPGHYFS